MRLLWLPETGWLQVDIKVIERLQARKVAKAAAAERLKQEKEQRKRVAEEKKREEEREAQKQAALQVKKAQVSPTYEGR